jgi:hypothetical protein
MADDLKLALGNVIQNKGNKHFFFLYGTGKRKDGKGDGALVVAATKPKRTQAEERCECKEVFEGECWAAPDGTAIFFEGKSKKLSKAVLAKMMVAVKAETGRKYDFTLQGEEGETPESETSEKSSTPPSAPPAPPGKKVNFDETAFRKVWPVVKQTWQTASEKVDAQLGELIKKIKADPDPEMKQIAEMGLNAVTGDFKVPLMASMREIDAATGTALQQAVGKARRIVADFRNHLEFDERVAVCEDNPWGVAVTIQPTLGRALETMDRALLAVAK